MITWINSIMSPLFGKYFLNQVLTITIIFLFGLIICGCLFTENNSDRRWGLLLSFPTGLAAFMFVGVFSLIMGIPYNAFCLVALMILLVLGICVYQVRKNKAVVNKKNIKIIVMGIITCVLVAIFATSGKTSMSVSNDSLYYFWKYPRAIVHYEGLRDQFDNFLTDTGLGASVIGTLPFLFGFGETFGIQEFFHINFVLIFGNGIYEEVKQSYPEIDNKKACVISILSMILIAVCTPVYILAHWAMSNMYFMYFAFMALILGKKLGKEGTKAFVPSLLMILFGCSQLRMEGGIFVLVIVMILSFVRISTKEITGFLLISLLLQIVNGIRVFYVYNIDNPYLFMTVEKAMIQIGAYVCGVLYFAAFRNKISGVIKRKLPMVAVVGIFLVNVLLCVSDSVIYIGNLKAFYGNLFGQSGWGMLPYITIGSVIILLFWEIILNRNYRFLNLRLSEIEDNSLSFWTCSLAVFFLTSLAVSFARGDMLDVNTGDSGNRVLLQIAPLVIIFIVIWFVDLLVRDGKEGK